MKFPRHFLLLFALAFAACETPLASKSYRLVRVTNPRGELIADWIAEGPVWQTERGYRFRAVQRTTGLPEVLTMKYPHGRRVEVGGPNIFVTRVRKPLWLAVREGTYTVVVREEQREVRNWK